MEQLMKHMKAMKAMRAMKGMKLTKKNLKVFGKEFEKEPLFKKVCLNLSECEENKIFMNFMLFMV